MATRIGGRHRSLRGVTELRQRHAAPRESR